MDCEKANEAMLQHMDGKIKPAKAAALARHVLKCQSCREYFLAFDEAMEDFNGTNPAPGVITEAPEGFAASVMTKISALPAYAPAVSPETGKAVADIVTRVFWGLCAVLMGLALGLAYNRDAVAEFLSTRPELSAMTDAVGAFLSGCGAAFDRFLVMISQVGSATSVQAGGSITALGFALVIGSVLFIIYRGEKANA
ncbi:MAG: hypothetical protein LBR83_01880 [Clostridiales bacterium]|jgi:predicted anti-sigma-YlaC factor YlaD|nr:hypothetical protein [Clostridiales bacterium]